MQKLKNSWLKLMLHNTVQNCCLLHLQKLLKNLFISPRLLEEHLETDVEKSEIIFQ